MVKFTILLGCFSPICQHGRLANPSRGFSIPGVEPDGAGGFGSVLRLEGMRDGENGTRVGVEGRLAAHSDELLMS